MGGEGTESARVDVTDDSNIIAKYPDVPGMSEKATTLTQRKRELILNSKRYYLHIFTESFTVFYSKQSQGLFIYKKTRVYNLSYY